MGNKLSLERSNRSSEIPRILQFIRCKKKIIDLGSSAPVLGDQIRRVGDRLMRTMGIEQTDWHKWMILKEKTVSATM